MLDITSTGSKQLVVARCSVQSCGIQRWRLVVASASEGQLEVFS